MALEPVFSAELVGGTYQLNSAATPLDGTATSPEGGQITYQWYSSTDGTDFSPISGETGAAFTPPTSAEGTTYYRVEATNTVVDPDGLTPGGDLYPSETLYPLGIGFTDSATATSNTVLVTVVDIPVPVFNAPLVSADYTTGDTASPLDGTATVTAGTITYDWQKFVAGPWR